MEENKTLKNRTELNRRTFLRSAVGAAFAGAGISGLSSYAQAASKSYFGNNQGSLPNIVFIMADDLGFGELGCYGQEKIKTPNIDRLASEGMRFTQAYAGSSVCAPSRSSLLTGFHNGHNRIRDNLPHGVFLRPDDVTAAEVLQRAGYYTGCIGKWGVGNPGSWGVPERQGFDYFYGHKNQDQAHFYYPDYLWENDKVKLLQEMEIVNEVGKMVGNRGGENRFYTHDLFTKKALQFIDKNHKSPFFLYLPYTIPHFSDYPAGTPEHFIVPDDKPYSEKDWTQIQKNYAAMITRMDGDVGKIIGKLKKYGLESNTLVIFTSDNGPYGGAPTDFFNSAGPFRGKKRDLYEGGIRVPFIAKWPGVIKPGTKSEHIIAFWDVLPTLAETAGLKPPKNIDGISFLPVLKGKEQKEHDYLFWDYGHVRKTYKAALRTGEWKGVFQTGRPPELYNLKKDKGENNNIAKHHPEIVQKIRALIDKARKGTENYPNREF
ncbi:arylsulfatase [Sedimentisphaera salicampi]|uniref:Arylsulfatase n=1 Tax=Sedimentisphaera salicampi TaxID=1941349 RepID=A0A1W6LMX3_9BACT|nr:arylsulfatase [Sedimentisphaera salicampi]ARN57101.1 Arylsulfatase precursor [Sedimentisphaera salicampi]OXU14940.1 Arylsulfatase precursor [Sedimentisphaera salicampi]